VTRSFQLGLLVEAEAKVEVANLVMGFLAPGRHCWSQEDEGLKLLGLMLLVYAAVVLDEKLAEVGDSTAKSKTHPPPVTLATHDPVAIRKLDGE
jgi:hypothetical protein